MANPNNALGTNAAFGGRTSVNAFNDVLSTFESRGILSGWGCSPSSGMTVTIGGDGETRDVAIAEDNSGNRTTVNNISQSPISVTVSAAPSTNSRIDAIVVYIENSPSSDAVTDNYDAVNLITVSGTAASSPNAPNDSTIRTAITADGASGATAYYVVLAYVTISAGTTDIDSTMISSGDLAKLTSDKIDLSTFGGNYSTSEINTGFTWIDGKNIYKKTVSVNSITANTDMQIPHGIANLGTCIKVEGFGDLDIGSDRMIPGGSSTHTWTIGNVSATTFNFYSTLGTAGIYYFTLYYTKSS